MAEDAAKVYADEADELESEIARLRNALAVIAYGGGVRDQRAWMRANGRPQIADAMTAYPSAIARVALDPTISDEEAVR